MHEVSIMNNAMKIILDKANENNAKKINSITVNIGELSGVMPEALTFAFEMCSKESIAEGALFHIQRIKATAACTACNCIFEIDHYNKLCPKCNKYSSNILTGYELNIDSMEVD
jgi:hydrogenase nickel incorporation protein HypA/HybF